MKRLFPYYRIPKQVKRIVEKPVTEKFNYQLKIKMQNKLLIFTVTLISSFISGQENEWVNISPFDSLLNQHKGINGSFISANEGWIYQKSTDVGETLYHTADGGESWDTIYTIPEINGYSFFEDIQFVDENTGFAIVSHYYSSVQIENYFWKTSDGGVTWEDMTDTTFMYPEGFTQLWVRPFYFLNDSVGFAGGPFDFDNFRGRIYKTIDGGQSWYETNIPNLEGPFGNEEWMVNKFYFLNNLHGWAVCSGPAIDAGMAWKTTNGGENWEVAIEPGVPDIWDIHFFDENHGGVTARNFFYSDLILTEDNFNSESFHYYWEDLYVGYFLGVCFQTENVIWVIGQFGYDLKILKSENGGETFEEYQIVMGSVPIIFYQIQFFENTGYIFATNRLLKYEGDVNSVVNNSNQPEKILINSIYPNPFNPTTTIHFQVNTSQAMSLKVYDIRGRMVDELVNGKLESGVHKIVWNGKDKNGRPVSSGVYLYTLMATSNETGKYFSKSNKMVLLK